MKLVQYEEYIMSALWIVMAWCFSTRASVPTVLSMTHVFPVVYGLKMQYGHHWCQTLNRSQNGWWAFMKSQTKQIVLHILVLMFIVRDYVPESLIDNKSSLVWTLAWHHIEHKPLLGSMIFFFFFTCINDDTFYQRIYAIDGFCLKC